MKPSILLVEDEKKLAQTIRAGLEEHNYHVSLAFNGKEGKELFLVSRYDLIILDINLPYLNGYDLCKFIRKKNKGIPIILLTALNFTENKVQGFDSGADDYLSKPFEFVELLARIKALLRRASIGKVVEDQPVLKVANLELDLNKKEARRDGQKITLTAKEFQLLEYFIRNKDKVVSRDDISKNVWDSDFDPQTNVIDVYVNFLRKKLDKGFSPKLIYTLVGMGYMLKHEENENANPI